MHGLITLTDINLHATKQSEHIKSHLIGWTVTIHLNRKWDNYSISIMDLHLLHQI